MRYTTLATTVLLLGGSVLAGCNENPLTLQDTDLDTSAPNLALAPGETFSYIKLTAPSATTMSMTVGGASQMAAKLYYSLGGTLASAPYASWRSSNECVASVTNASPKWGYVRGVSAGTAIIITEAFGKADSVTVTVTGTGNLDPTCASRQWSWNYDDLSFTGTPASSYGVTAGEKMTGLVLFAGPKPDYTIVLGKQVTLKSELWYDRGGKLNGRGYVTYSVTDGTVASINANGVVTGRKAGRTKVIARLGTTFADTVPLYVR